MALQIVKSYALIQNPDISDEMKAVKKSTLSLRYVSVHPHSGTSSSGSENSADTNYTYESSFYIIIITWVHVQALGNGICKNFCTPLYISTAVHRVNLTVITNRVERARAIHRSALSHCIERRRARIAQSGPPFSSEIPIAFVLCSPIVSTK